MKTSIPLAVALAIGAATAAHANTGSASIKFSNLNISTIDLTPSDNLAPGYEVMADGAPTKLTVAGKTVIKQQAPGIFAALSASSTDPLRGVTSSASIGPSGFQVSASGPDAWASVASSDPAGHETANVRLAPWTGILVSGNYEVTVSAECSPDAPRCGTNVTLQAAFPSSVWNADLGTASTFGQSGWSNEYFKSFYVVNGSQTFSGSAGTVYWNFTDHVQDLALLFKAQASVNVGAVPEPTTVALIMAGLAGIALTGRKASRRA